MDVPRERGAFDFIAKPGADAANGIFDIREDLLAKIKSAVRRTQSPPPSLGSKAPARALPAPPEQMQTRATVVAIGTSTGGPKALQEVLSVLPAELPAGILVVQHMPVGFTAQFAERLNHLSKVRVREVQGEEVIEAGTVYIAPAGLHMTTIRAGNQFRTHLSKTPAATLHTPSVDILMHSVARVYGSQAMGVILTGMGADGAQGMKAIRDAGGWTVGQDAESCAVYGMPRSAAEMNALCRVAPLEHMAGEILLAVSPRAQAAFAGYSSFHR